MTESTAADPIDHVVLLLMENHSFDQMLGCLDAVHDGLDGVINAATRTNADGQGGTFSPKPTTERQMLKDPHHDHPSVLRQIADDNGGFVREFTSAFPTSTADERQDVMGYYPLDFLPALHTLGRSFTVCDMWFSSLPGPTWPNRFFALTGTSMGETAMPGGTAALDPKWYTEQSQDTIFDRLDTAGKPWKVYFNDFPCSLLLTHQHSAENLAHYEKFDNFFKDAAGPEAEFPAFTFIEPRYFGEGQNDDHPPHNTMKAEKLIADTYNALRSNPDLWATTLLVVVYDEHGGFYDHVTPPPAVAPDDRTEQYDFARLGVRVPALLVSPWCDAGVHHAQLDHTSLLKYLCDKWGMEPLGARAMAANSISPAIRTTGAARVADTPPFIRVPNQELIPANVAAEQDSTNANSNGLHQFADFLLRSADVLTDDAVIGLTTEVRAWFKLKHDIGKAFVRFGDRLSKDFRDARKRREELTAKTVEVLRAQAPAGNESAGA